MCDCVAEQRYMLTIFGCLCYCFYLFLSKYCNLWYELPWHDLVFFPWILLISVVSRSLTRSLSIASPLPLLLLPQTLSFRITHKYTKTTDQMLVSNRESDFQKTTPRRTLLALVLASPFSFNSDLCSYRFNM